MTTGDAARTGRTKTTRKDCGLQDELCWILFPTWGSLEGIYMNDKKEVEMRAARGNEALDSRNYKESVTQYLPRVAPESHSLCHGATEITWGDDAPCGKNLVAATDRPVETDGM